MSRKFYIVAFNVLVGFGVLFVQHAMPQDRGKEILLSNSNIAYTPYVMAHEYEGRYYLLFMYEDRFCLLRTDGQKITGEKYVIQEQLLEIVNFKFYKNLLFVNVTGYSPKLLYGTIENFIKFPGEDLFNEKTLMEAKINQIDSVRQIDNDGDVFYLFFEDLNKKSWEIRQYKLNGASLQRQNTTIKAKNGVIERFQIFEKPVNTEWDDWQSGLKNFQKYKMSDSRVELDTGEYTEYLGISSIDDILGHQSDIEDYITERAADKIRQRGFDEYIKKSVMYGGAEVFNPSITFKNERNADIRNPNISTMISQYNKIHKDYETAITNLQNVIGEECMGTAHGLINNAAELRSGFVDLNAKDGDEAKMVNAFIQAKTRAMEMEINKIILKHNQNRRTITTVPELRRIKTEQDDKNKKIKDDRALIKCFYIDGNWEINKNFGDYQGAIEAYEELAKKYRGELGNNDGGTVFIKIFNSIYLEYNSHKDMINKNSELLKHYMAVMNVSIKEFMDEVARFNENNSIFVLHANVVKDVETMLRDDKVFKQHFSDFLDLDKLEISETKTKNKLRSLFNNAVDAKRALNNDVNFSNIIKYVFKGIYARINTHYKGLQSKTVSPYKNKEAYTPVIYFYDKDNKFKEFSLNGMEILSQSLFPPEIKWDINLDKQHLEYRPFLAPGIVNSLVMYDRARADVLYWIRDKRLERYTLPDDKTVWGDTPETMELQGYEAVMLLASKTRLYCLVKTRDNGDSYHLLALPSYPSSRPVVLGKTGNIGKSDVVHIVSNKSGETVALIRDAQVSLLINKAAVSLNKLPVTISGNRYLELTIAQNKENYTGFTIKQ